MEINELMIGDIVFNTHHNEPIRLTQYDFFTHSHDKQGKQYFVDARLIKPTKGLDLQPIPLTDEILKLNSVNANEHCDLSEPLYTMGINAGRFHITGQFKYVHELQHALRLCGLNEIADNFKI